MENKNLNKEQSLDKMNANDKQVSQLISNIKTNKYYELMNEGKKITRSSLSKNDVYEHANVIKEKKLIIKQDKINNLTINKKVLTDEDSKNSLGLDPTKPEEHIIKKKPKRKKSLSKNSKPPKSKFGFSLLFKLSKLNFL